MKIFPIILLAIFSFAGCAPYGFPRANEKVHRNVVFASPKGQRLHMDLYIPKTKTPPPVVVWIFGGSWRIGNKGYHLNLRDLTKYGIAVAAIEYRLSGTAKYPAQLEDCRCAVEFLEKRGGLYGVDPKRIGFSGESAGGHLAALLGTVEGSSKVRAVCALYPPTNLVTLGRMYSAPEQWSDIENLLGGPIEEKLALAADASPVNHVSKSSPPFLFIHGKNDTLVPLVQSKELHAKLLSAGIESRLLVVPDKGHWFILNEELMNDVGTFFNRHF